jgi:hypothetical protein
VKTGVLMRKVGFYIVLYGLIRINQKNEIKPYIYIYPLFGWINPLFIHRCDFTVDLSSHISPMRPPRHSVAPRHGAARPAASVTR